MTKSKFLFIFLSSIISGLLVAVMVMAWTNPVGNPTSGGGALYYSNGNVGIGTVAPQAKLDVNGGIRVGSDTTCNSDKAGTMRYNAGAIEYCNGSGWLPIGGGAVSGTWCGLFASGVGDYVACNGILVSSGCPSGYSRVPWAELYGHIFYSCFKN